MIAQFLQKCAEDDAKEALARKARDEAMVVRLRRVEVLPLHSSSSNPPPLLSFRFSQRYKAEVESQRSLNQHLFEAQKLEEARVVDEAKRREAFKRQVIDEARRRLLQEHAVALRGFLPRGVIASPRDLAILKVRGRHYTQTYAFAAPPALKVHEGVDTLSSPPLFLTPSGF